MIGLGEPQAVVRVPFRYFSADPFDQASNIDQIITAGCFDRRVLPDLLDAADRRWLAMTLQARTALTASGVSGGIDAWPCRPGPRR